ncbi:MAG: LPS assembly protein LptD [Planctomycetes bacterium]|nr:LPS assembly protein LptD [Planctomycetota bacterium]
MSRAILLLLMLSALPVESLHAQEQDGAELDISYVVEKDQQTFWDSRQEGDGYSIALPFAIKLRYADPASKGNDQRKFVLLADRAVVWFTPQGQDVSDGDPFAQMSRGVSKFQFYGEGNIWMKYTLGDNPIVTMRADRIYLDFARNKVVTYNSSGQADTRELLNLRGHASGVKIHSGAEAAAKGGQRVGVGAAVGPNAEETTDPEENVGAAPSDDAVPTPAGRFKALPQEQGLRLFARADELRLYLTEDLQEVELDNGSVSSSSLAVASYSLYADSLTIRLTPLRGTVYLTNPAARILDYPIFLLPVDDYAYDIGSQPPIRQLQILTDTRFGYGFRTYVDAIATYDFFWDPEPPFTPLQLGPQIDYYSKRGLGLGVNLDWGGISAFQPFGRSSIRSLYINDPGDKRSRARDLGWYPVEKHSRGRFFGAYSQNFGDGWQLDHLLNYSSDRNFRREFYEDEYNRNEPENSFIQLTKRYGALNFFLLVEPKVHPWQNKTEYLPTLGFDTSRVPLGDFGLQFSSHTEASILRFMSADGDDRDSISTIRADSTNWFDLPFELGPFALDPFVGARATVATSHLKFAEGAPRPGLSDDGTFPGLREGDDHNTGLLYRLMPFFGANFQTFFTGTWGDVTVPGLAIDGLRHVFAPFVRYTNHFYNSLDDIEGRAFVPLDPIDTLDEFHEIRVGFRNRIQTRQGWGAERRTVDYFEVMLELPIYPQRERDNGGYLLGDLEVAGVWRPAPGFAIAGNMFIDPRSGNFNRAAASFSIDFPNWGRGSLYYRLLKGQHQVVGIQGEILASELYTISFKQEYDLQAGKLRDTRIEVTRRILETFDLGVVFVRDAVDGGVGFYLSLSLAIQAPSGSAALIR